MNQKLVMLSLVALMVASCVQEPVKITLTNPTETERTDEAVIITREQLAEMVSAIPDGEVPLLYRSEGDAYPCQADDIDQDGNWDELFFLVDMQAEETKSFVLEFVAPADVPVFERRTNIRFGDKNPPHEELDQVERLKSNVTEISSKHFQMEGPAWENDIVGFRNYFDARNGIDIFGKRIAEMALDSVGLHDSYHELALWGMDILKVGNSLGAGAIGMLYKDSVYRLGLTEQAFYKRLFEGPLRSMFRMTYTGWEVDDNMYDVTHDISIWGGQYFYKSSVSISGMQGDEKLVTGIVNMESDTFYVYQPGDFTTLLTHANQGFDGEVLGMALLASSEDFVATRTAPEEGEGVVQTYMMVLDAQ
ncbi:MAG: DUF4861 family protein, partial [Mariniphaga sp.]